MLDKLTHESFEPLIGQNFKLSVPDREYEFRLVDVEQLPVETRKRSNAAPARKRVPFSLFFVGEPLLPQGIYSMQHEAFGSAALQIFIVPVSKAEGGYRYEAVFS